MHDDAKTLYADVKKAHERQYKRLIALRTEVHEMAKQVDLDELADVAFALREIEKLTHDIEKEARLLREFTEKLACAAWVQIGEAETIKTEYCTATPSVKMMVSLPTRKNQPEQYQQLCLALGIPSELIGDETDPGPVSVNWPGMVEYLTAKLQKGEPLPAGLDMKKTYNIYKLNIRKRKEIDD